MNKIFIIVALFFIFFTASITVSCASSQKNTPNARVASPLEQSNYFTLDSQDGSLVVLGVSSRMVKRNEEIAAAQEDAAKKVALYYGVSGSVESNYRQGASFFDYIADSSLNIESTIGDYSVFIDGLTFNSETDVIEFQGGSIVRFHYSAGIPRISYKGTLGTDGRPSWINRNNFSIEGYVAAVGFSQNQVWLRDTVMKATEATAARLISGMETVIETTVEDVQGQSSLTYITTKSSGVLNDFRIIEFWIDPSNLSVYALGVARAPD